ncbi:hypothetical protein F5Y13DRAFT_5768 [Hypoxylon sp. FL1857]|nr:hypothetical protein F5Y13DRAFT_5768 [Hypoxylon sp. FL1857]
MSAPFDTMNTEQSEVANLSQAINEDSTTIQPGSSAKPEDPANAEESTKAKSTKPKRVTWDADMDQKLLMAMTILATSNGQEKLAVKTTTATGQEKGWRKIELSWQVVADIMGSFTGNLELSKDAVNQRFLKHILPHYKAQYPEAFTNPPHADDVDGGTTRKPKRKAPKKKAEETDAGPATKKVKTEDGADQDKAEQ